MSIKELQDELSGILFSVDKHLRSNIEAETSLLLELKQEPITNLNLNISVALYTQMLKLHDEGKTDEEVKKGLEVLRINVNRRVRETNSKLRLGNDIKAARKKYTDEQLKEFDDIYAETIRMYHPLITLTNDQINITTFNMLRQMFMAYNYDGFKGLQKEHPITVHPIKDEAKAIDIYNKNIKLYKEQYDKMQKDEKFIKIKEIVSDDALLAREEAGLRQQNYKLKQQFEDLKKKVNEAFPNGIKNIIQ